MQTVQLKKRVADAQSAISAFAQRHEREVRLAANAGIYTVGAVIVTKGSGLIAGITGSVCLVIGSIGLVSSALEYTLPRSEERSAGDVKTSLAA